MRSPIAILILLISFQVFGQHISFFKTKGKKDLHYLEFNGEKNVIVFKMGTYFDKAGSGPAIILKDTLILTNENEFKGKHYTLSKNGSSYTLVTTKGEKHETEPEKDLNKVNSELNNAYCLKSYFNLSDKLNKEFPLYHYTYRNGYYAWQKQPDKTMGHDKFTAQTDREIIKIYDSISKKQKAFINTTNFIAENAERAEYSMLKDSINTLPVDYKPQSGYFDRSVYMMAKSDPEYFYKLLQDFPASKTFIYFAVDHDKALVKKLRQVRGYDGLKKEFFKEYKYGKTIFYRVAGTYAVMAGLIIWLIVAQP